MPPSTDQNAVLDALYSSSADCAHWQNVVDLLASKMAVELVVCCREFRENGEAVNPVISEGAHAARSKAALQTLSELNFADEALDQKLRFLNTAEFGEKSAILHCHETPFFMLLSGISADDTIWLNQHSHHILRAAKIRRDIEDRTQRLRNMTSLLQKLSTPVLLVDRVLEIVVSNKAAVQMQKAGIFQITDGKLFLRSTKAMERARDAIAQIANGQTPPEKNLLLKLGRPDGGAILAAIEPLDTFAFGNAETPRAAVAAIVFRDPERRLRPNEAALQEMHELPPAEVRFAVALTEGVTIKAYARRENLSEGYVRDLSKRVMQRIGVNRQPDLIRIIMALSGKL